MSNIRTEEHLKEDISNRFLNACDEFITNCLMSGSEEEEEEVTPKDKGSSLKEDSKKGSGGGGLGAKDDKTIISEEEEATFQDRSMSRISTGKILKVDTPDDAKFSRETYSNILSNVREGLDHNLIFESPGPGTDSIQVSILNRINDNSGLFEYRKTDSYKKFEVKDVFDKKQTFEKDSVRIKYNASLSIPNSNDIAQKTLVIIKFYDPTNDDYLAGISLYLNKLCENLEFSFKDLNSDSE